MTYRANLLKDPRGATAVETAFVLPILLLFVYGIFQIGVMFQANAGIQNGLGAGARFATIFPVPTNAQIQARISSQVFGVGVGTFGTPTVTNGTGYKDLAVTFTMTPDFLFFKAPAITLNRTKRVYVAG